MSKIALLFPGQGAQSPGMGKSDCDNSPVAKNLFDRAEEILGYDLATLCFTGSEEELSRTDRCQVAIFVASLAALATLEESQPELSVQAAAGLSLGEYTALVFAGALSFEDGLRLVKIRGEAMQRAAMQMPSGMVSVAGLDSDSLESLCSRVNQEMPTDNDFIWIANFLCPGNIVVSGKKVACSRLEELAPDAGAIRTIPLAVAGAFHTPIMACAAEELKQALAAVEFRNPRVPVITNVNAHPYSDSSVIRETLLTQLCSPVQWEGSMRYLLGEGFDTFYEVGPGRVLRGLMKRIDRKVTLN